jgi:general stress protein 26
MLSITHRQDQAVFTERQRRIHDFLNKNHVGVLATVDPNGDPHGAVVYHTIDKGFDISFLTKTGTKKYDNLVRDNHVVLVVFEPTSQAVVTVTGKAYEVVRDSDIEVVATEIYEDNFRDKKNGVPPISKLQAGDCAAFDIIPDQIKMAEYADSGVGDYEKIFESIESFELYAK